MQAYAAGGMTPKEVLTAATLGSAETIGRLGELGSLEPGKYADLVVLSKDPLADVKNLMAIDQVMKNGRIYDPANLNEVWPRHETPSKPWWVREDAELRAPQ
jgi:imidazolonepropionase-like amidohydrolase